MVCPHLRQSSGSSFSWPVLSATWAGKGSYRRDKIQLARRCAWISTQCEVLERRAEPGQPVDLTLYTMLTGHLTRTFGVLGLKRQPRDVTPTLQDYLKAVRQPEEEMQSSGADSDAKSAQAGRGCWDRGRERGALAG